MSAFQYESTHLPFYEPTGPNSNTFALDLLEDAGATGEFPANAYGAVDLSDSLWTTPLFQAMRPIGPIVGFFH
jgi:hypothetical protein